MALARAGVIFVLGVLTGIAGTVLAVTLAWEVEFNALQEQQRTP